MHRHIQRAQQEHIRERIAFQGFALIHSRVGTGPEFSFTIGLHCAGSAIPEIALSGLSRQTRVAWLLDLGFRLKGPPPLPGRAYEAKMRDVPIHEVHFPPGGEQFLPGYRYRDFSDTGLPACFGEVTKPYDPTSFGQAITYHRSTSFPMLQLVWSDRYGHFPWEEDFEEVFFRKQQVFFDPGRYLPLKDFSPEPSSNKPHPKTSVHRTACSKEEATS